MRREMEALEVGKIIENNVCVEGLQTWGKQKWQTLSSKGKL